MMALFAVIAPAHVFAKGFKLRALGRGVRRLDRLAVDYGRTTAAKVFPAGVVQTCHIYEVGAALWAYGRVLNHTSIMALAGVEMLCR